MMDISKIGTNIRVLREEKGITREQFCEEEKELSSRQLMRIEKGQSTPTLEKLAYIAEKLDVTVIKLLDLSATSAGVPQEYWNLKQEIENYNSFDDDEKEMRIIILMKMYDHYYDILPNEEQLFVDCMMTLNDIYEALNTSFLTNTINRYNYVLECENFGENELLYVSLYLLFRSETNTWGEETDKLIEKIIQNQRYRTRSMSEVVVRIYINAASHYLMKEKYNEALDILNIALELIHRIKVYNRLPIVYMLFGKVYIGLGEKPKGKKYYCQALELAQLVNLEGLRLKIQTEKDKDVM